MKQRSTVFLTHECTSDVHAPAERVFAIVGDPAASADWAGSGNIRSITKTTDGPIGVGTQYRSNEKITMPYHGETEIVEYEPNTRVVWISKPAGERVPFHRWSFQLEPVNGGTRVTHRVEATRARGYMGWVQRLGFLFTRPKTNVPPGMERTLVNIKALAEGQSKDGE